MRLSRSLVLAVPAFVGLGALAFTVPACSGTTQGYGFANEDGGGSGSGGGSSGGSGSGSGSLTGDVGDDAGGIVLDGSTVVTTTIYAHNDTTLYSMNPQSKALTLIGTFTGLGGGSGDTSITDLAVNAAGDVYVNSETVIYKAALPAGGTGSVVLTTLATIAVQSDQSFYALAFTPANALGAGTGEVLIGGDGNGELWSIDSSSGATKDLGNFGADPDNSSATLALSGDIVFYMSNGSPTGLATIRSCTTSSKGSTSCGGSSDFLAGIDMKALATAYTSGTPAATLNAGIYGSPSPSETGPGTGFGDVFGLGVWGGNVYGFSRGSGGGSSSSLISIATTGASAGAGTVIPTSVSLTSGWAGAGVTSSVSVTVAPPPPPPTPK
ncbi:MAG: hypothetical protein ACLQBL_11490 [Polyangiaceae bacterium]|jgi:hypothetical protein